MALESCAGLNTRGNAGSSRRPNLRCVFAAQLGYPRCGYAGDAKARTPNIDTLTR